MNPQRFLELLNAYGAAPERWPLDERDTALAFLQGENEAGSTARMALANAREIDGLLADYRIAPPDAQLMERITASFDPKPKPEPTRARSRKGTWRQPRLWLTGAGFLGAGAVGVASGILMMSLFFPASSISHSANEQTFAGSVFGHPASDWSEE